MAKGTLRMRASVLASSVLPLPVGPISSTLLLSISTSSRPLAVPSAAGRRLVRAQSLVVVVHGDRERLLGVLLADDVLVEEFLDLPRAWGSVLNSGWLLVSLRFSWRMMLWARSTQLAQM